MLTIVNNQQSTNFQARAKMGQASKIGAYLKNKGINTNKALLTSAGSAGVAGSAIMSSPEMISAPAAAKWAIGGGMLSTLVPMGIFNYKNRESSDKLDADDKEKTEEQSKKADAGMTSKPDADAEYEANVVNSPIGKINLTSEKSKSDYASVMKEYNEASTFCDYWRTHSDKPTMLGKKLHAEYLLEIIQSKGDLLAQKENVINSKTFGTLKLTKKGLEQYIESIKDYAYAEGFLQYWRSHSDKSAMLNQKECALSDIAILRACGEL